MNMQQIIAQAQNIAKYVEMVNNQVQQIQKTCSVIRRRSRSRRFNRS